MQNRISNIIAIFVIESGVFCQQHVNKDEDFEYYIFIVMCFYLSLLKHSNLDFAKILRMKLLWDVKFNRFTKVEIFVLWRCIYGMDKQFIKDCLRNELLEHKQQIIVLFSIFIMQAINQIAWLVMNVKVKCREKVLA